MARYTINDVEYPGVTTVLGLLDKSAPLMGWATGCMEKYIIDKIEKNQNCMPMDIIKIVNEARFNYKEVSKEALDVGSTVHKMIEEYVKAKIQGVDFDWKGKYKPEVENGYLAFLEWEKKNVVKYLESEQTICSLNYGYAGTLDIIARLTDRGIYCIDLKASKGFYDGYGKQVISYASARQEVQLKPFTMKILFKNEEETRDYVMTQPPVIIDGVGVLRLDKETGQPEWKDYTKNYDRKLSAFLKLLEYWYTDKSRQLKNNPFVKKYGGK